MAADGGYLLWMTSSLSSHSTSASVSERSRLVTHTAVSSSNVIFQHCLRDRSIRHPCSK